MSFTGKSPANTYKDITYVDNNNSGADSTARQVKTGNGANTSIKVSDRQLLVTSATNNVGAMMVKNAADATKFVVDTANDQVKALGTHVNTQYAYFGLDVAGSANYAADTHHAVPFFANSQGAILQDNITFGTSTDPATSFTTADGSSTDSGLLVPFLWYVPDSISIDKVFSIEGKEDAATATTRCHLYSYTFNTGSTSALTSGTLLAHNSDVTNAGSEQAYLSEWTVDSASVAAGKVILAFFRMDSTADDYGVSITVKYHLT